MYLELLIDQWESQGHGLDPDPAVLAGNIGAHVGEFQRSWPTLKQCFPARRDGRLENKKLAKIWRERRSFVTGRREAGREGGKASAAKRRQQRELGGKHSSSTASESPSSAVANPSSSSSSSSSSASASSTASAEKKKPRFSGQRLTVFDWHYESHQRILGALAEDFGLDDWYRALDKAAVDSVLVIPRRDGGEWLESQLVAEAERRNLPVARAEKPLTAAELKQAREHRARVYAGCPHEQRCETGEQCVRLIARQLRGN